jgi:hypothetical protein
MARRGREGRAAQRAWSGAHGCGCTGYYNSDVVTWRLARRGSEALTPALR